MTVAERLAAHGERFDLVPAGPVSLAVRRVADDKDVGTAEVEADDTPGLTIHRLCIDEADRSYGAGSEAAWLLVRAAESAGYSRLRAWAHPSLGLSVYFWIRMGFSPRHGEGPDGGIWFERGLK
ncbi:MAG: GNAT family N-acetyltransferase [Dehalococcoidia bacterium]|nr:GNAT family N-acetyltransferase [Dehalococcoidia bacterium]